MVQLLVLLVWRVRQVFFVLIKALLRDALLFLLALHVHLKLSLLQPYMQFSLLGKRIGICFGLNRNLFILSASFGVVPWRWRPAWSRCLRFLSQMQFHVSHIYREGNQAQIVWHLELQVLKFLLGGHLLQILQLVFYKKILMDGLGLDFVSVAYCNPMCSFSL